VLATSNPRVPQSVRGSGLANCVLQDFSPGINVSEIVTSGSNGDVSLYSK
jgi:hypothetical protein